MAPQDVCITVEVTDRAGNALTPLTSCSPCHLSRTETGEEPDWSEDTLNPNGVCSTLPPTPQHLPGLALPPGPAPVASGCSVGQSPATRISGPWLAVALLGMRRRLLGFKLGVRRAT